jgi:hypothetical protein
MKTASIVHQHNRKLHHNKLHIETIDHVNHGTSTTPQPSQLRARLAPIISFHLIEMK